MFALPKRVAAFVSFKMRQENYSYIRIIRNTCQKGELESLKDCLLWQEQHQMGV